MRILQRAKSRIQADILKLNEQQQYATENRGGDEMLEETREKKSGTIEFEYLDRGQQHQHEQKPRILANKNHGGRDQVSIRIQTN